MRRVFRVRVASCVLGLALWASIGSAALPTRLRILTYNIHHGEGTDGSLDLARVAAIITSAAPDLVALQEVDRFVARTGRVHQLEELERLTGLHGAFGKAMDYQGGDYGVAVLSRRPIVRAENHALASAWSNEPRTALTVQVELSAGQPLLHFTSTHLDDGREVEARLPQVRDLIAHLATDRSPRILAGDMNSRSGSETFQVIATRWTEAFNTPEPVDAEGRPRRRVDYVFVSPAASWQVVDSVVIEDRLASDHRPVLAVVDWTGTP